MSAPCPCCSQRRALWDRVDTVAFLALSLCAVAMVGLCVWMTFA